MWVEKLYRSQEPCSGSLSVSLFSVRPREKRHTRRGKFHLPSLSGGNNHIIEFMECTLIILASANADFVVVVGRGAIEGAISYIVGA